MGKNITVKILALVILTFLGIAGCNGPKSRDGGTAKSEPDQKETASAAGPEQAAIDPANKPATTAAAATTTTTPAITEEPAQLEKVIFFIENSGSMFGYINQANEFKNSLVGIAYLPEFDKADKSFYFINGTSSSLKNSGIQIKYQGDDPEVFKNRLNPASFNVGDVRFSDLNRIFEIALDSAKGNQISVIVSDCIYDVGEETDPLTALKTEIQKTQHAFRTRLQNENIQTLVIKAGSRFNGQYYYASKKGSEKIQNTGRPFYIIFLGKSALLNKALTEQSISGKIVGPHETARYFINDEKNIPFQIVPSIDLKGEFKPDFKNKSKLTKARPLMGEFQFAFAVDFSSLPFSDSYYASTGNYDCPYSNFSVVKVTRITKKIPGVEGTHLITVFTDKNPLGDLQVVLKNVTPGWVMETHIDNEDVIDSTHTFGFKSLMDAVSEAYDYVNHGMNPATFKMAITK